MTMDAHTERIRMEQLDCKSDSSDSSVDLNEPANASTAGTAAYIPGASLSDKLRLAASKGQTDRLKALITLGASFEPDREGRTALHYAAVNGFAETVLLLIYMGCDIDARDKLGYTAVHRAAAQGHTEVIKILAERGCWLDSQDEMNGNSALHEAGWNGFSRTLQILVTSGADIQLLNKAGFSPLHMAAQNGHNNCARILLYAGCNPLNKNSYGDTALHTAVRYGHAGIARILISARCNVNDQNKNADTALHIAAALKRRKITKLLVEAGAMIDILNRQGETALEVAQRKDHLEIVQLLSSLLKLQQQQQQINWVPEPFLPFAYPSALPTAYPNVLPVNDEVPQTVPDEEGKKKKRGFFFKKKKKTKDKDRSADSGSTDPGPSTIPPGVIPSKPLPSPEELIQGFQKHQAQRQQNRPQCAPGPSGYVQGNTCEISHGVTYYMDLAGNIRQGPSSCECSCPYPIDPVIKERQINPPGYLIPPLMPSDQIEVANRRLMQQAIAADTERRCHDRNVRTDAVATLEERVRKQFNMQKGIINAQPSQKIDQRVMAHVCSCEWCQGRTSGRERCHKNDVYYHRRKCVPETPPPGKIYKSKSDETLSTISSHANKRHLHFEAKDTENPDARVKSRRQKERRDKRSDACRKGQQEAGNTARARTPDINLDNSGFKDGDTIIVPANVRAWLIKQEEHESNTKPAANPSKKKYTEIYDL